MLLARVLSEVGDGGTCMGLNSWDLIVEALDENWETVIAVSLLEILWHVISKLANAVKSCISDHWVLMSASLKHDWDHDSNLGRLINVLSNLGECHDTSMLVSPVLVIGHGILNKFSNKWKHNLITDGSN